MKLVVISLERALDRRARMRAQLDALEMEFEFFDAIDGARGDLNGISRYDEARALREQGLTLLPAEIGCFASHFLLWQRCAERDEPMIIMEDDLEIDPAFAQIPALLDEPLRQRGFLRLAGLMPRRSVALSDLPDGYRLVRYAKGPLGAQCYALHPDGARTLLRHAQVWVDAVDRYMDAFWIHGVASHAVLPSRVRHAQEGEKGSMIGARWDRPRPWRDRLRRGILRNLWSWRRRWFNLRYAMRP